MFRLHFANGDPNDTYHNLDFKCQEDWKAAIYKWGGPKPSELSRVELAFDKEAMEFQVFYLEKRFDRALVSVPEAAQRDSAGGESAS